MSSVSIKPYASPTCVLLAFDWPDGEQHPDFLGFAIRRTPGFAKNQNFLVNKLDFKPIAPDDKPKPSDQAPIQKFNWWDSGFATSDRGKTFQYEVIPVLGTGPGNLKLQQASAGKISVALPQVLDGKIATYFNRAVVSSQAFLSIAKKPLEDQMDWLANGLQAAVPQVLGDSDAFDCAIYHLSDGRWILPSFEKFTGRGSLTYFFKGADTKSQAGADFLKNKVNISKHKRTAISKLMHDKFIVSFKGGREVAVLMGSTNFTPEAQTIQANLLHILHSPQLADLYMQRSQLLAADKKTTEIAKLKGWHNVTDIPGTSLRVFFTPEPGKQREFLDTVTDAVKAAKSSVLFCMFTASDEDLMKAIFAKGDSPDHLIYGLINTIDDPDKPTKSGEQRTNLPKIAATIFHRSHQKNPDTLAYDAFTKEAPRGFLPELRSIDTSKYDVSLKRTTAKKGAKAAKKKSGGPPPIHVHHKFIVIDGDTEHPTIYTGSPNFSKASENGNDENELEIKGNTKVAQIYVAEFMRLYNHYRARALWDKNHPDASKGKKAKSKPAVQDSLVLATTRDGWAKDAFTPGSKAALARKQGL